MNTSREIVATTVGAVIGGVAGYLLFTGRGRNVLRQIQASLEDSSREFMSFRNTVQEAAGVAHHSWRLLHDTLSTGGTPSAR